MRAKMFLPPVLWEGGKRIAARLGVHGFRGEYADFAAARRACIGYEARDILQATVKATQATREALERGQTLGSRDLQLGAAFARVMGEHRVPSLRVLDFGGALGAHYFVVRRFLPDWQLTWHVVELPETAREGQRSFATNELTFLPDMNATTPPYDVVLASSSLQYVPDPVEVWKWLASQANRYVLLNRVPMADLGRDRVTVQNVLHPEYRASYPAWFLDETTWIRRFEQEWSIVLRWEVPEDTVHVFGRTFSNSGLLLRRKVSAP